MANQNSITCPHCGQYDKVYPASNARISAPPKPSDTPLTIIKVIRWIFGSAFGLASIVLLVFIVGGVLLGGFAAIAGSQYDDTGLAPTIFGVTLIPMLCGGVGVLFVLLLMGVFMIGFPWLIHRYVDQNYQQRLSQWQRAINKYRSMYFCSRCAGVFLPGQNRIVPIEQMQSFLYEIQISQPMYPYGG